MADSYSVDWLNEMAAEIGILTGKEYVVDHAAGWCLREKLTGKQEGCVEFLFNADTKRGLGQRMYVYRDGILRGMKLKLNGNEKVYVVVEKFDKYADPTVTVFGGEDAVKKAEEHFDSLVKELKLDDKEENSQGEVTKEQTDGELTGCAYNTDDIDITLFPLVLM